MPSAELEDDLQIPAFLRRQGNRLSHEQARALADHRRRVWAPFRDHSRKEPNRPTPLFVDDREAPVVVNVRQKTGSPVLLERYANAADFEARHDASTYPVVRTACYQGETLVLVSAKPWAGRDKAIGQAAAGGQSKAAIIGALLGKPEGTTTAEILAATGWPSVSVPAQAKACGLELRKEKIDGVLRYYGRKA
jgi:hypothetical protein